MRAPPHHLDLNENRLAKDFSPNLRLSLTRLVQDGRWLVTLQSKVADEIRSLPHLSDLLPVSYFRVKDCLAAKRKDFIDYREYKKICVREGVTEEVHQQNLIQFLHDLGDVLYFHDSQSPYR